MSRLYPTAALALAGLLVIGCREDRPPTPTEPQFERIGRIKIDGVLGANEWRDAERLSFMASAPEGLVPAELLSLKDDRDLYLALRIQRPASGLPGSFFIFFDNDNDAVPFERFDDLFSTGGVPPASDFGDSYMLGSGNEVSSDQEDGGTSDGVAAVGSDANSTVYELRKPLNARDIHDFALTKLLPAVGIQFELLTTIPGGSNPAASGEGTATQVPTFGSYCRLTAFPRLTIDACAAGELATVRITPRQDDPVVRLISMGVHQTFLEPLGLHTYDYMGNPVTTTCTWQSDNPGVVQVDQQGHITTGDATGAAAVGAVCLNTSGMPILGAVRVTVE
jgi:hypothetical protein